MRVHAAAWLALTATIGATACNPGAMLGRASAQKERAEHATARFRAQLDSAQFDAIYRETDEDFRKAVTKGGADSLWTMVRRRFGAVRGAQLTGWNVSITTQGGTQVRLVYQTAFVKDSAVETFTWRIRGEQPGLLGYNINSPALLRAMAEEK